VVDASLHNLYFAKMFLEMVPSYNGAPKNEEADAMYGTAAGLIRKDPNDE
jgi:hypothetical protein